MNPRSNRLSLYGSQGATTGAVAYTGGSALSGSAKTMTSTTTTTHQGIFQEAVRNGDAGGLQRMLEELQNKVDVNCYNNDGQTALHQSCQDGNLELVKLLVQFGADVRLANRDGWSALHIAAWSGHREIAMYLINAYKR